MITTRVKLDKISSSTRNAALAGEVIVGDQIVAQEGYVLAVRIKHDKSTYNEVEDLAGRMVKLRGGDVLAFTLMIFYLMSTLTLALMAVVTPTKRKATDVA
jgi:hypothetical protein